MNRIISAVRPVRFRGKYRLMSRLAPKHGIRAARIFGYQMNLDLSDWIQRNIYLGSYEQPQTSRILSHLRPGMTFLDVGANIGYYSAMASSIVGPTGRVISYEPNAYAFDRLTNWIHNNSVQNVTSICAALGAEPGTLTTHFAEGDNHTASLVPAVSASDTREKTKVSVKTLDREAARLGIRHIDVMKIDVDGYESQVFQGASQLLAEGRIGAILCEFSQHWLTQVGSSCEELERFFLSVGFDKHGEFGDRVLSDRWFVKRQTAFSV